MSIAYDKLFNIVYSKNSPPYMPLKQLIRKLDSLFTHVKILRCVVNRPIIKIRFH